MTTTIAANHYHNLVTSVVRASLSNHYCPIVRWYSRSPRPTSHEYDLHHIPTIVSWLPSTDYVLQTTITILRFPDHYRHQCTIITRLLSSELCHLIMISQPLLTPTSMRTEIFVCYCQQNLCTPSPIRLMHIIGIKVEFFSIHRLLSQLT